MWFRNIDWLGALKPGHKVRFKASVISYNKGYTGEYEESRNKNKKRETDYRLEKPSGVFQTF